MKVIALYFILVIILPLVLYFLAMAARTIIYKKKLRKYGYAYMPIEICDEMEKDEEKVLAFLAVYTIFCGIIWVCLFSLIKTQIIPMLKYKSGRMD